MSLSDLPQGAWNDPRFINRPGDVRTILAAVVADYQKHALGHTAVDVRLDVVILVCCFMCGIYCYCVTFVCFVLTNVCGCSDLIIHGCEFTFIIVTL